LEKLLAESEKKRTILTHKFLAISDVAIIEELNERVKNQRIKLSMYPQQDHIYLEAKDIDQGIYASLPIEVKKKDHD
jgi:hypothetical protein